MVTVFVGGSARAGTTLLQSVLCTDGTTNPLVEECSYLRHMVASHAFGAQVFPYQTKDYFESPAELREFGARWVGELLERFRRRHAAADVVLKEPLLTPLLPALAELVPEARFVVSVRDPRDTIASMVRVLEQHRREGRESDLTRIGRDMRGLAAYYASFYEPVLGCAEPDFVERTLIVRHEDLTERPESIVDTLRAFTGLALAGFSAAAPWSRSAIDFESPRKKHNAWTSPLYGRALSSAHHGAWSRILTGDEAAAVERHCAKLCETFGYAVPIA